MSGSGAGVKVVQLDQVEWVRIDPTLVREAVLETIAAEKANAADLKTREARLLVAVVAAEKEKGDKRASGEDAIDAVKRCREIMEQRRQERLAVPHCDDCNERDPAKLLQFTETDGTLIHWCVACMADVPKLSDVGSR